MLLDILLSGLFHAAVLFLVAAGLQLVFGVQKIVNLACGVFYALGAYFGISVIGYANAQGVPAYYLLPLLRSEEHTSELQSLMRISYAVFCLKKNKKITYNTQVTHTILRNPSRL